MAESANVLVRVWLPDRPGALGLVASRIGAVRGDIVGIDVLERDQGVVIDEFAVRLADLDLVAVLVKEVEEVDGASVEEVRIVQRFPDPRLDALQSAATLCEAPSTEALGARLVGQIRREFLAEWTVLLRESVLLASEGESPSADHLQALAAGTMASPSVAEGETGPGDLAIATLEHLGALLMVGRDGQAFRLRERAQLFALARVADRAWQLLDAGG
ncbi:MAG TPA: hypothetical protein VGN59_15880 [Acidimicrobiia bacterium]|jgi:hypothetical protein